MYRRAYYGTKAPVQAFCMSEPQHGGFNMSAGFQEHEHPQRRVLEAKIKHTWTEVRQLSEPQKWAGEKLTVKVMRLSKSDFRAKHSVILCCCKQLPLGS